MGCGSRSRAVRGGWTPPTPAEVSPEPSALPEMFGGCRKKADREYKEQIYFYLKICNSFMIRITAVSGTTGRVTRSPAAARRFSSSARHVTLPANP